MFSWLPAPTAPVVIAAGVFLLVVTVVQLLIGYRKIRFKGRLHLKVHKALAWVLLVVGVAHGLAALILFGVIG